MFSDRNNKKNKIKKNIPVFKAKCACENGL